MKPLVLFSLVLCCLGPLCWVGCQPPAPPATSLHQAVEQGDIQAVQQHIAAKTDLNQPNLAGWTPLHVAAMNGNLAMVQTLIAAGADANRKGQAGKTPLDVAREKRQIAIVQVLQQQQAAPKTTNPGRGLVDGGLGVSETLNQ
jgi:ankyrin repeat protein